MAQILNFTGSNGLGAHFEIPFQTSLTKEVRCRVTLPVTPSIPSFFMYNADLVGEIPLADFMANVARIPAPTAIEGYLQFSIGTNGEITARITRPNFSVNTSGLTYTSSGRLYSLLFYNRWIGGGWPPVWEGNINPSAGTKVTILDNPNLSSSGGGGLRFTWRT